MTKRLLALWNIGFVELRPETRVSGGGRCK